MISTTPIADIEFEGLHWIEASAGSGKTFTLSALMVRIFLEKYMPRQVVATTFTRKAAAELKLRIRKRVNEMRRFFDIRRSQTVEQNLQQAKQLSDELESLLLHRFADQTGYASERLRLASEQLDELFVGTLDSFSQKLLREFAFESGKIEPANLTEDVKSYTHQIIHDVLREWLQAQSQTQVDWLYRSGMIGSVETYSKLVSDALNFSTAKLETPIKPDLDFTQFKRALEQLASVQNQITDLAPYTQGDYFKFVNKKAFPKEKFATIFAESIPSLIAQFQLKGAEVFFKEGIWQGVETLFLDSKGERRKSLFNKCDDAIVDAFHQHPVVQVVDCLIEQKQKLSSQLKGTQNYLKFYLCQEVKKRLPQLLQQKSETTFSQQIRTLADALKDEQGQKFAEFVQKQYPLILVDEFQDTNQDQDDMLASIWRNPKRYMQGCMIMVGDRKQAIYGFRGGDMLTFLKAHQDVTLKKGKFYNLIHNYRTVTPLVEVVDLLFRQQPNFGEDVEYLPVQAGQKPHPALIEDGVENLTPLRWYKTAEEHQQVAWQICHLLQKAQQNRLMVGTSPIIENDIAVLSKNHVGLDKVQYYLERLGIRVNRPAKRSVFDSTIAQDVAAVLTAIMHPFDEAKIKRALLSRMLGFNLAKLQDLEKQADGLSKYITIFDEVREMWFERNFLSAWQYCLKCFDVWQTAVASKSRDNERTVVNLRHLTELLSQHSTHYQGPQNLYQWYFKQLASPSEREWELERKLSDEAGVQLMTIHQSKGLEFKIVFLLGADASFKEQEKTLNFSSVINEQQQHERILEINDKENLKEEALKQHQERAEAEQHRLWYVALTRASHRVYAMLSEKFASSTTGLAFWLNAQGNFSHVASSDELEVQQPLMYQTQQQQIVVLDALALPNQRFYPRLKTSFTALAQHLNRRQALDLLAEQQQHTELTDDETDIPVLTPTSIGEKITWIAQHFPMGKQAGNFLHEIFEHLDFKDTTGWDLEITRRFKNDYANLQQQILEQYTQAPNLIADVKAWLFDVLNTPLHDDFSLSQLQQDHYLSEFPFYLAMTDKVFAVQRIHQLLQEYDIHIPELYRAESARFLTGAIDLVYEYEGAFYIADYKSNFLGDLQVHYQETALQDNMTTSSYWLQASLYLVALHRYLKQQLANYDIDTHLGGATYLYLRGMNGQPEQGVCHWRPESEFILRLDAILGYM
ncbi:UvrD-helicase domain-containing protein [Acinetobacter sp. HY1485]|uniref:UvrD-helicase domain-containing protein n=1 Tax=Acinetobacter sp. HY1485 TaxID=2970918 RepID=UPI0022B9D29B|nr:UvrD-helicase domain-containing protein [Acinetobacter sp. HY1485]